MKNTKEILESSLGAKELDYKNYKVKLCPKCGVPTEKIIYLPALHRHIIGPVMCKCKKEEFKKKEVEEKNKEKQLRLERVIKNSLMDEKFRNSRFETWDFSKGSKKMYKLGTEYVARFSEMKERSVGMLIYGEPGNGKTFTTACMANALLEQMIPTVCVSINSLLDRIKETYTKWGKEVEEDIIRGLCNADLLIIDDLGTEQGTEWSRTKIYNILDSRYRNGLPLIITTNIELNELKEKYHARTYDRILEMCTPKKNDGESIRVEKAKEKTKILKELLK